MRKEKKYYELLLGGSQPRWGEVEGESVEGVGGVLAFVTKIDGQWGIINTRSGQPIGKPCESAEKAIECAAEYVDSVGLAQYLDWQKQDIFDYGESPAMEAMEIQVISKPKAAVVDKTCVRE